MKTYQLKKGETIRLSVDGGDWQDVVFLKNDFKDIGKATAKELINVFKKVAGLEASEADNGELVLSTVIKGSDASIEIDFKNSSAAAALGISSTQTNGLGLSPAGLISRNSSPFDVSKESTLNLSVDGVDKDINFKDGITEHKATAKQIAKLINATFKDCCATTHDGRLKLTSPAAGPDSYVEVRSMRGRFDAAKALGFTGSGAVSCPCPTSPASMVLFGQSGLCVVNLTRQPIEVHLPTGPLVIGRNPVPLSPVQAGSARIQALRERGLIQFKRE